MHVEFTPIIKILQEPYHTSEATDEFQKKRDTDYE